MAEVLDDLQGGGDRRRSARREADDLLSGRAGRPIGFGRTQGDRIATNTIIEGSVMGDHWRELGRSTQNKFITQMRIGLRNGESTEQMAARISGGTIAGTQVPGVMDATRKQARTLVRTSTNAVQNRSRLVAFQQSPMVKAIQQVSTLDNRTSQVCVAFSGQVWDKETLAPVGDSTLPFNGGPPRHFNCRSTLSPVLMDFEELGFDVGDLPPATRASIDGQVPADITFDGFLRGKTKTFQDQLLGPARAQLWRDGRITLTQLVDMRGNPLTVTQLEELTAAKRVRPRPPPKTGPTDRDLLAFDDAPSDVNTHNLRAFKDAPPELKNQINAAGPLDSLTIGVRSGRTRGAYYEARGNGRINMDDPNDFGPNDRAWDGTWQHEYGHHIDFRTGTTAGLPFSFSDEMQAARAKASRRLKSAQQSKGSFINSKGYEEALAANFNLSPAQIQAKLKGLELDPDELTAMWRTHFGATTDELAANMSRQLLSAIEANDAAYIIEELLRPSAGITPKGRSMWSHFADFFGAMTKNRIGFGHSKSYYAGRWGGVQQGTEMYANFVTAAVDFPQLRRVMELFAPEWTEQVLDQWRRSGGT